MEDPLHVEIEDEGSDKEHSLNQLFILNKKKIQPQKEFTQKQKKNVLVEDKQVEEDKNKEENEVINKAEDDKEEANEDESKSKRCKNCSFCAAHCPTNNERKLQGEKKRVECNDCKKIGVRRTFKDQESLEKHVKHVHKVDDEGLHLICTEEQCSSKPYPVILKSKASFKSHMTTKHKIQILMCEVCSTTFKLRANFKAHMLTHNLQPKKAFKCGVCGGTFVNRAGYESHQRRFPGPHVKQTCRQCGVSFSKEQHMKNHRCKIILIEEGAAVAAAAAAGRARLARVERMEKQLEQQSLSKHGKDYGSVQTISVPEPMVIQEVQDARESEQMLIRELAGQMVPGTQLLQFEVGDAEQPQQVYQVNVADWNMVAPFVIRDPTLTTIHQADRSQD